MSDLAKAFDRIEKLGWMVFSLNCSSASSASWLCQIHPAHFGSYFYGVKEHTGLDPTYRNRMVIVTGFGMTPADAAMAAFGKAVKSEEAREIYDEWAQAIKDWNDALKTA